MNKATFMKNWFAKKSPLPPGVIPLKYLESTGTQWIETGKTISAGTNKVKCTFQWGGSYVAGFAYGYIFGGYGMTPSSGYPMFNFGTAENKFFRLKFTNASKTYVSYDFNLDTEIHSIAVNINDIGFSADGRIITSEPMVLYGDINTCPVFTRAASTNHVENFIGKIFSIALDFTLGGKVDFLPTLYPAGLPYIDGNTLQTVTPSVDKSGMYDTISGHFFVNHGKGADFLYAYDMDAKDLYSKGTDWTSNKQETIRYFQYSVTPGT